MPRLRSAFGREPRVGETIGPYRLERVLGDGAMGIVFLAASPDGGTVALKILRATLSESEPYTARFLREARIARGLDHPNLVPVLDAGQAEGRYYLAMRHVPGHSLEHRLAEVGQLPLGDLARLVADIAAGLDALHGSGLVHRDVKPSNIVLDDRSAAALTDFGLARGPAFTVLTQPGQVLGTPHYLAPELISGERSSPASDIYALGCMAYECLTGSPPFDSDNVFEITVAHLEQEPADPSRLREGLPTGLSEAVCRALAKDPAARPATARSYALSIWRAAQIA